MPQQINGKVNVGIVLTADGADANRICELLNTQFANSSFNFAVGWDNVDILKASLKKDGVSIINELNKILVFDSGFENNVEAVSMINKFISLEETMSLRGVRSPELLLATSHQGLYDLFKKDTSPEGHELFSYEKTKVVKINVDDNGDFNLGDIQLLITNGFKNFLSIKNTYRGRENVAQEELKRLQDQKLNKTANVAERIKAQIQARDNKLKEQRKKENELKDPWEEQQKRDKATRAEMKNTFAKDNQAQTSQSSTETGLSTTREFNHGGSRQSQQYEDEFQRIRYEMHATAKTTKQKAVLNFDSKIYDDTGKVLIGGLSQSGTSSTVANLAQYYALMNKKVLIVNLSDNDHITRYFKDFIPKYNKLGRKNVLLTNFSKSLSEISVPVKPNIELISDYGLSQKRMSLEDKLTNYSRIIRFSEEYDIVLLNTGINFEEVLLRTSMNFLDDVLIITTQDDLNEVPIDLVQQPYNFAQKIQNLKHPIGIIVNKIQYSVDNDTLSKAILHLPIPLDSSRLLGAISYQNDWYQQRLAGVMSVTYNDTQRLIFHELAKKIILKGVR